MKSGVRERGEREDDVCQKTSEIGRRVFFERDSEGVFGMRSFCPSFSRAFTSANFSWSLLSFQPCRRHLLFQIVQRECVLKVLWEGMRFIYFNVSEDG